jgi:hypothetical protein
MLRRLTPPVLPKHHSSEPIRRLESWLTEFEAYMINERGLSVATQRGRRSVSPSWHAAPTLADSRPLAGMPGCYVEEVGDTAW